MRDDVRGVFPQERASSPDFSRALSVTNPYARHRMVSCHGPDGVPISQTLESVEAKMTHTTENKPPKRSFFQKIFAGSFFLLQLFFSIIVLAFALLDAILLIWLPIGNWVFWALFAANASLFALSCAAPLLIIKFTRHSPLKGGHSLPPKDDASLGRPSRSAEKTHSLDDI